MDGRSPFKVQTQDYFLARNRFNSEQIRATNLSTNEKNNHKSDDEMKLGGNYPKLSQLNADNQENETYVSETEKSSQDTLSVEDQENKERTHCVPSEQSEKRGKRAVTPIEDILKMMEGQVSPKKPMQEKQSLPHGGHPYFPQGVPPHFLPFNTPYVMHPHFHNGFPMEYQWGIVRTGAPYEQLVNGNVGHEVQAPEKTEEKISNVPVVTIPTEKETVKSSELPMKAEESEAVEDGVTETELPKTPLQQREPSPEPIGVLARPKRTRVFTQPFSPIKTKKRTKLPRKTSSPPRKALREQSENHDTDVILGEKQTVTPQKSSPFLEKLVIEESVKSETAPPMIIKPIAIRPEIVRGYGDTSNDWNKYLLGLDLKTLFPHMDFHDAKLEAQLALDRRFESFSRIANCSLSTN